jgi:mRNA interferase RelE/StbE
MQVEIDKKAQKEYLALPSNIKERIKNAMLELKEFPDVSNIKRLSNYDPAYRKRVGDYRILFDVLDDVLTIYEIRHRREAYDG